MPGGVSVEVPVPGMIPQRSIKRSADVRHYPRNGVSIRVGDTGIECARAALGRGTSSAMHAQRACSSALP